MLITRRRATPLRRLEVRVEGVGYGGTLPRELLALGDDSVVGAVDDTMLLASLPRHSAAHESLSSSSSRTPSTLVQSGDGGAVGALRSTPRSPTRPRTLDGTSVPEVPGVVRKREPTPDANAARNPRPRPSPRRHTSSR